MNPYQPYQDGYFGAEGRKLTVVPRTGYPFENNPTPDTFSRTYDLDWMICPALYFPRTSRRTAWTSLVTYAEDPTQSDWTAVNVTAAANITTAPDGNATMARLLETVTNGEHSIAHAATVTAEPTEASVFAKGGLTREWIKLLFTDSAATVFSAFFNVARGYFISASANTTARIIPLGGGFFRCVLQFTPAAGAGSIKVNVSTDGSSISYAGNTAMGVYVWGAQVNTGTDAPYVSTFATTRTIIAPDRDDLDPFAFLVYEEPPMQNGSEMELIRRQFARVPLTQVVPSFTRINKPGPSGALPQQIGAYVIAQPDQAFAAYDAYFTQVVATDSGSAAGVGGVTTGGTYTISFDGDTTAALAFNANAGAVQAALNALPSVTARGGLTVSGDYLAGFAITFANIAAPTMSAAGLTWSTGSGTASPGTAHNGFFAGGQITSDSGGTITGGTYTFTLFGQTTAGIPYNASVGSVQSAVNALSLTAARGGVTVCPVPDPPLYTGGQISVFWTFQYPAFTFNTSALLPSGSTATATRLDPFTINSLTGIFGRQQSITFSGATVGNRDITTVNNPNGIVNGDAIYAKAGSTYYTLASGQFSVTGPNSIRFNAASGAIATATESITEVGKRVRTNYVPGTVNVRCKRTSTFYLPGVTPGINSSDDIIPPVLQSEPETMLQLIFSGAGAVNYDVGELEQYRGPILSLTVVTILATDL